MTTSSIGYYTNSSDDCPTQFLADSSVPSLVLTTPNLLRTTTSTVVNKSNIKHLCQSTNQVQCPLCVSKRNNFYCAECVTSGDFVHSTTKLFERFSEKNLRLFALQRDNLETKNVIDRKTTIAWSKQRLKEDIKLARNKIKFYRHVIKQNRENKSQGLAILNKIKDSILRRQQRLPEFADKANRMKACVDNLEKDRICPIRDVLGLSRKELKLAQAAFVVSLFRDVFPLIEVLPNLSDPQPDLMLDCLADAMRTSYIHGRWVTGERSGEVQYQLVAPLLPGSGDYTPVYAWIAGNNTTGAGGDSDIAYPAHTIAAGLSLACQLVSLIAGLLDVHLPSRLQHQDFGVIETSEFRFALKVTKLNLNVVCLCLSTGLSPSEIRPTQTLHNLLRMLKLVQNRKVNTMIEEDRIEVTGDQLAEWETALHREAEELKLTQLSESEDSETGHDSDTDLVIDNLGGEWESLTSEHVTPVRQLERQSSMSFVSSTVSSLLWGLTQSPKSPKK